MNLRTVATVTGILALLLVFSSFAAMGTEEDGQPVITPHPVTVEAGASFDLEVSVQAWANSSYTVTFENRTRFSFPGARLETQVMAIGDAILFKVRSTTEADTPDGDFPLAFKLTWTEANVTKTIEANVTVVVGEGAGTDNSPCESMVMVGSVSVLAVAMAVGGGRVGRRR